MQKQKQHDFDEEGPSKPGLNPRDNQAAKDAAKAGRDLLDRLEEASKQKRTRKGHYETDCCGIRRWVEE